jgi:hypothetical protein
VAIWTTTNRRLILAQGEPEIGDEAIVIGISAYLR